MSTNGIEISPRNTPAAPIIPPAMPLSIKDGRPPRTPCTVQVVTGKCEEY